MLNATAAASSSVVEQGAAGAVRDSPGDGQIETNDPLTPVGVHANNCHTTRRSCLGHTPGTPCGRPARPFGVVPDGSPTLPDTPSTGLDDGGADTAHAARS